jgi:hypothetical protein
VADRSSQLLLQALSRAAAESSALPLFAGRGGPGLFPATAAGKQAAQRCRDEGYLLDAGVQGAAPLCVLSDKGRTYLLGQLSPREVLEDFVRALEARESQAAQLISQVRQMQASLEGLRQQVEPVLEQVRQQPAPGAGLNGTFREFHETVAPPADPDALALAIVEALGRWVNSGDCALPELFRQCGAASIGAFHDSLRHLEAAGRVYLHPWTAPLYAIPEPAYALLAGHAVCYFASLNQGGSR